MTTTPKTVFQRICDREIPADIVYEDEECVAFRDINPQAPIHILVVPRQPIVNLATLEASHEPLLGHLLFVVSQIAQQLGLNQGYRVVINTGPHGGQTVDHLHIHLLAGRPMSWPPG